MSDNNPYLSLVVTARNDDHGGSLLRRMQAFVNGWVGQCKRHGLSSELIVVDWNPPEDRPPLIDALRWPPDTQPCQVRFVQVPPEVHQRYTHAAALPLYQMIAKNVGIRRSRGRFLLVANIDIIFSDDLIGYLAEERLEPGRMYRIDRHDVMSDVPVDGTVDEQLAYCDTHLIRVNAREGTFDLTPDGLRALSVEDIAGPDSGISFGTGWHGVERYSPRHVFRWIGNDAEVMIRSPRAPATSLTFDLEPGPSAGAGPLRLKALADDGTVLADADVSAGTRVEIDVSPGGNAVRSFRIHVTGGGLPVPHDPRILNLRAFRCEWASRFQASFKPLTPATPRTGLLGLWTKLMHLASRLAQEEPVHVKLSVPGPIRRLAGLYIAAGGFTGLLRHGMPRCLPRQALIREAPELTVAIPPETTPVFLHTNACGDFTLMAREHWMDLRGYPEFDMYSFNIDSLLCYAAHHGGFREQVLEDPLRIYHIEHGTGSGWTPEGQAKLFNRLKAKGIPWLEYRDLVTWAEHMRRFDSPMIFNRENWGLKEWELPEMAPNAKCCARPASSIRPLVR
jgi:hypothetical protein